MMTPNYMQAPGSPARSARPFAPWPLRVSTRPARAGSRISTRSKALVTARTKVIFICNPNNPTGCAAHRIEELDGIGAIASPASAPG